MTNEMRTAFAMLRDARKRNAEWYSWIADGMPRLSPAEYERRTGRKPGRPRRSQAAKTPPVTVEPDYEPLALDL